MGSWEEKWRKKRKRKKIKIKMGVGICGEKKGENGNENKKK